jgi:hypothetical protein
VAAVFVVVVLAVEVVDLVVNVPVPVAPAALPVEHLPKVAKVRTAEPVVVPN